MSSQCCPVCYAPLEVREVGPCFVCGGWTPLDQPAQSALELRLPAGQVIALCDGCLVEEFMVKGGFGYQLLPDVRKPAEALRPVRCLPATRHPDKFCPVCHLRLALLKLLAELRPDAS